MTAQPTTKSPEPATDAKSDSSKTKAKPKRQDGLREISESFVVAFVLAFLFRAFEAEAFVIPTGSMAPTLLGRHKECTCKQCGFFFTFGASDEIDEESGTFNPDRRIQSALCPNCRFENDVLELPAFKGDRIIVSKFPYEFGDPQRWDVPVFKYPERPTTNYIKRLVGLPNETVVIKRGDVYRREDDRSLSILRKEPYKQKVLQIPVYHNDHQEKALHQKGWPKRWAAVEKGKREVAEAQKKELDLGPVAGWIEATNSWDEDVADHAFELKGEAAKSTDLRWLRYRHIVPSITAWDTVSDKPKSEFFHSESAAPQPQIITEFCGYNSYSGGNSVGPSDCYWVGDLTLSAYVDVRSVQPGAEIVFELNEGVRCYRVRVNLETGKAQLISVVRINPVAEEEDVLAEATTSLRGVNDYSIRFANVDDRLCFWVNESLAEFGTKAEYRVDEATQPGPRDEDLIPVGIAAKSAGVRVSNLLIERDIYYRASQLHGGDSDHFSFGGDEEHPNEPGLRNVLRNPSAWWRLYDENDKIAEFKLDADEYLMLGDNSPRSQDSRVWPNSRRALHRHAVPRSAFVGRAFFVYWPHGVPFLNDGQGFPVWYLKANRGNEKYADLRLPFYPNFGRMRRVR